MTESDEDKSRARTALVILLYFVVIMVITGIIYVALEENESESNNGDSAKIELNYVAKTENGSYLMGINVSDSPEYHLNEVNVSVYKEVNDIYETVYSDKLLAWITGTYQSTSPEEKVIYNDVDNNDIVSTGDLIFIWIDPQMPDTYTIKMNSIHGEALAEGTFTAE
ncbi:MAG: hypothetical protein JSW28_09490 [Thermoplasmata archaeon]|nr:MAG: hypothetical protein JSW28_09490 [Thermoplasmata archaeon]